jgi:hypothetical protein
MEHLRHPTGRVGRRGFLAGAGGALATAGVAHATGAQSDSSSKQLQRVLPAPEPISGGIDFGEFIHVFIPGREGVVLPFTGTPLMGSDVEPSTITDCARLSVGNGPDDRRSPGPRGRRARDARALRRRQRRETLRRVRRVCVRGPWKLSAGCILPSSASRETASSSTRRP